MVNHKEKRSAGGRHDHVERRAGTPVWIFGYGSLIWDPCFPYAEAQPALLSGYHRALCIYSYVYRGTKDRPGLVLGLEPGGSCRGVAFRIPASRAKAAIARVTARENVTGVYWPRAVSLTLLGKGKTRARRVRALAFIAERDHPQYAGKLSPRALARCLREGKGTKGRASDYLRNVLDCLANLGIRDRGLERIGKLVKNATR